jgi:hypothetical protein
MITRRRLLAAAVASPIALAGCKIRTINYFPTAFADVRFLNVMLDSTGLDVVESGTVVFANYGFEGASEYAEFENTQKSFALRFTGQSTDLATIDISLGGEQKYTLVAYSTTAEPFFTIAPDVSSSTSGNIQLRLINVAVGGPQYDLYITAPDVVIDGTFSPSFIGINPGSSTTSLRFAAGTYRIRAAPNGSLAIAYDSGPLDFSVATSTDIVLYTLGSLLLPQGLILDVDGAGRRVVVPNAVSAVRVVNAALQSGAVNAFYDGTVFAPIVIYPSITAYSFQAAGLHTVSFQAVGSPGETIASLQRTFDSAKDATAILVGLPGALQVFAIADDNRLPVAGTARVRYVNASSDNLAYDVFLGDTRQVSALAARTASDYQAVTTGSYSVTFRDPATGAVALTIADVSLNGGNAMTFYLTGIAGQLNSIANVDR